MGVVIGTSLLLVSGRKIAFQSVGVKCLYIGVSLSLTLGSEGSLQPSHVCVGLPMFGKLYAVVIDFSIAFSV